MEREREVLNKDGSKEKNEERESQKGTMPTQLSTIKLAGGLCGLRKKGRESMSKKACECGMMRTVLSSCVIIQQQHPMVMLLFI